MTARLEIFESHSDWEKARKRSIGASDVSAIMGFSHFDTPYSLWHKKVSDTPEEQQPNATLRRQRRRGHLLEPLVREEFLTLHPEVVLEETPAHYMVKNSRYPFLHASTDNLIKYPDPGVLQLKTTRPDEDWGKAPTMHALLQVQTEMLVTGRTIGFVAAYNILTDELVAYPVEARHDVQQEILEATRKFWGFLERGEEPPVTGSEQDRAAILERYPPKPGTVVELDGEVYGPIAEQLADEEAKVKFHEERVAQLKNMLRKGIGTATRAYIRGMQAWNYAETVYGEHVVPERTTRVLRKVKLGKGEV